ncbi:B-cell receptor CD22-like [Pelobates fuscus]|uniref:B-cell receptor CD22-like n=1 Tax=Pelobates fuscus TaxID=191477 RepID=UPI002FE483EE
MPNQHNLVNNTMLFILICLQGLHSVTVGQTWTFPQRIEALIGSCVVIPCSFTRAESSMSDHVVWYLYKRTSYPEVFNSRWTSRTIREYRGRTSLVSTETMSCSLRINYVRSEDEADYYPGIDTTSNAYDSDGKAVRIGLREKPHDPVIQWSGDMIDGQPITITCQVEHTCWSNPPTIGWNKRGQHGNTYQSNFTAGGWKSVSELIYTPSSNDHNTLIMCSAVHHNVIISLSSTRLNIKYSPKNVTVLITEKQEIMEEDNMTLLCDSKSNPVATSYKWYKGTEKITTSYETKQILVTNVSFENKVFSCLAKNEIGTGESDPTEIPVQYVAKNVTVTVDNKDGMITMKCDFLSSRPNVTHFTWYKNDMRLNETEQVLTMPNNALNSGEYHCIAHNTIGGSLPSTKRNIISSAEEQNTLPLILGSLAGVIVLLLLILVLHIYIRERRIKQESAIHGTLPKLPVRNPIRENGAPDDHLYVDVRNDSDTTKLHSANKDKTHLTGENSHEIYTNYEIGKDWDQDEVEYSVIQHAKSGSQKNTMLYISHTESLEYATVKK